MNTSADKFYRGDLLHAWLQGQRWKNAHDDLRDYHCRVANAFCKAFQVDLDNLAPDAEASFDDALNDLFRNTIRIRRGFVSPFSSYLEAPRPICELYQIHGKQIDTAIQALIRRYDELLLELLEKIFGIEATDFVSRDDLTRCGLPDGPAPDPIDYP